MIKGEDIAGQFPGHTLVKNSSGQYVLKPKSKSKSIPNKPVQVRKKQWEYLTEENILLAEAVAEADNKIYLPYNVVSLKNAREFGYVNGRSVLKYSDNYNRYIILTKQYYLKNKDRFLSLIRMKNRKPPYRIGFYLIRSMNNRWDYTNCFEGVLDLMVKYEWLSDDSAKVVQPIPIGFEVDKFFQGIIIGVL